MMKAKASLATSKLTGDRETSMDKLSGFDTTPEGKGLLTRESIIKDSSEDDSKDNIITHKVIACEHKLKRSEPKFNSIAKLYVSERGAQVGLVSSHYLRIGDFDDTRTFVFEKLKLMHKMRSIYESISVDTPEEFDVIGKGYRTKIDCQGIDLGQAYVDSSLTTSVGNVMRDIRDQFTALVNSTTLNSNIFTNSLTGIRNIVLPQIKKSQVCVLLEDEAAMRIVTEANYMGEYTIPVLDYYQYIRHFASPGVVIRDPRDVLTIDGKYYITSLDYTPFCKANYNVQINCDVLMYFREMIYNIILAQVRDIMPATSMTSYPAKSMTIKTAVSIAGKHAMVTNAVSEMTSARSDDLFYKIVTTLVCSRWVRLYDGKGATNSDYSFSYARVVGLILRRVTTAMRNWTVEQIRYDEIYLVVNFLRWYEKGGASFMLNSEAWLTGSLATIKHPIEYVINNATFDGPFINAVSAFLRVDDYGHGYLGAGLNPINGTKAVPLECRLFTINREIQAFSGNGYVTSVDPPTVIQIDYFREFVKQVQTAGNTNIKTYVAYFRDFIGGLNIKVNELAYYAQVVERLNYYFALTVLSGQSTDDFSVQPQLYIPMETAADSTYRLGQWAKVNADVALLSLGRFSKMLVEDMSFVHLYWQYQWDEIWTNTITAKPSHHFAKNAMGINNELRELAAGIQLNLRYFSTYAYDYTATKCVKMAIADWKSDMQTTVVKDTDITVPIGYLAVDGTAYFLDMYARFNQFIDDNKDLIGFADHFYYNGRNGLTLTGSPNGLAPFDYINVCREEEVRTMSFNELRSGTMNIDIKLAFVETIKVLMPIQLGDVELTNRVLSGSGDSNKILQVSVNVRQTPIKNKKYEFVYVNSDQKYVNLTASAWPRPTWLVDVNPVRTLTFDILFGYIRFIENIREDVMRFAGLEIITASVGPGIVGSVDSIPTLTF